MNPILVATDFSPRSDRALRRALLLAKQTDSALALLHVVADDQGDDAIDAAAMSAHAKLTALSRTLRDVDAVEATVQVRIGDAAEAISAAAVETGAELIVLGPHRQRCLDAFVRSTAGRVIRHANVPVLIARQLPSAAYSRALVGIDFEPAAKRAAIAAADLRLVSRSVVSAVHVLDAAARDPAQPPLARQVSLDAAMQRAWRETQHRLHALVDRFPIAFHRTRIVPPSGSIARTLLDCAEQEACDLIVTGTRRRERTRLRRFLQGSVAQELARASARDVLVVPESTPVH